MVVAEELTMQDPYCANAEPVVEQSEPSVW